MKNTSVSALLDLNHTIARALFEGKEHPWEVLPGLSGWIRAKGAALPPDEYDQIGEDVWIAKDADVAPTAYLNGPLIVDHGAEIRHCAFVRGSAVVGKNAVVGNSVELKNCVLFDEVRSDKQNVVVHAERDLPTGLRKLGAILGDRAEVGCNSVLNPGTVLGRDCIVYPTSCVRGVIPERSIFKNSGAIAPREERM